MKTYFTIIFLTLSIACSGQSKKASIKENHSNNVMNVDSILTQIDSVLRVNNALQEKIEKSLLYKENYKLYKTENIYTFLLLDTETGQVEQVQWSLDRDKEGTFKINNEDLTYGSGHGPGSFELYATSNMYQFLLLDKVTGRIWHIQWGIGDSKRWIRRIF